MTKLIVGILFPKSTNALMLAVTFCPHILMNSKHDQNVNHTWHIFNDSETVNFYFSFLSDVRQYAKTLSLTLILSVQETMEVN